MLTSNGWKAANLALRKTRRNAGAFLIVTTFASCNLDRMAVLNRNLPPIPDGVLQTVDEPQRRLNDNPKVGMKQALDALREANKRIIGGREWYGGVERDYAGKEAAK